MTEGKTTGAAMLPVDAADYAVRHPLRPLLLAGTLTFVAFGLVGFVVGTFIIPYVPPARLLPWAVCVALFWASWAIILIVMAIRRPDAAESVRVWSRAAQFLVIGSHTLAVWAIWAFLPYCPQALRFMLAALLMCNSPCQIICTPENVAVNRIGVVATSGSLVLWFVMAGGATEWAFAAFAGVFGLIQFVFCSIARNATDATVAARLESDAAARRLERALADVAEERDAKTRFIAAASHDLGQPLQAASLFFDQTLRAPDPDQRNRAADGVRKAFASADQLLSHMLNHLRLEADAVDPHFARFSVGAAMGRIAAQFGPAAGSAGIDIRLVKSRAQLRLDKVLFERALGNLVSNAIEHSGAKRIVIGARASGDRIRIWVIDDGSGIARVDAGRIFDDYYRGSDSRAAVKSGFGLGLSSVRRIAILMHGTAGLDPRWLGGSAFFLEFPVAGATKETTS
ncbi:sensor histidine kinase KdpD [Sphingomonas sp. SUN039]|uniref:sensor histidine kinase n=1 Tax=Sphingomonas sp. SUN039 TaxID=2937787 RepID=UPI00216464AE|nr:HAMP domain-containing sensor histidine kinase [Sphingomonas sp. SUN039]UVO53566.1 HAMP domain-containing histidine kinase [Sphingomonas sp. SUN039]